MLWILIASAQAASLADLSVGDLVVSELHTSPAAVSTVRGQWFELYNNSGDSIDLDGLIISDGGSQGFTVSGPLVVAAGEHVVFASRAASGINGGLPVVDYVYSAADYSLPLGNAQLDITYDSVTFDAVSFGEAAFPDEYGASISLDPGLVDATSNDDGASWCPAAVTYGDGDYGSPGAANDACPVDLSGLIGGDLVISEVMHSPAAVAYNRGEWVEIYNASGLYVDLDGLVMESDFGETLTITGETLMRPGTHAVIAARSNAAVNGGLPVVDYRYIYGADLRLTPTDTLSLSFGVTTFDDVSWNPTDYAGGSGIAEQLNTELTSAVDNDDSASWCAASSAYGDGDYGTPGAANSDCELDSDGDGYDEDVDCDDDDASINPGAAEVCDDIDNDCNGLIDDSPTDGDTWYADADGDYYGDLDGALAACERPNGYRTNALDCDDSDSAINPAASETCDGVDSNCSGDEDDAADATIWYTDGDSDGYGGSDSGTPACSQPSGLIADGSDCNDGDSAINPDASETCNGVDDNCSGDENDASDANTYYADLDKDFYGDPANTFAACERPIGFRTNALDCDDSDVAINPSAAETCDGIDTNCSGDESDASDASTWYADTDADGFGDVLVFANACTQPSGYLADSTDCDDSANAVNPSESETCDGVDNNCSGDELDASDILTWYADTDADGFGDLDSSSSACFQPSGYLADSTDCDDTSAAVNPSESETCDGVDNNCSGDENDASDASTWYADSDADGFGDLDSTFLACTQPSGFLADSTDCDDDEGTTYPGAEEVCNDGVDSDCDAIDSMGTCDASLANADAIFNGESSGDLAGYHMTGGDINGDGFSDVIVGARLSHSGGSDRGSTYVMFGPLTGEMSLGSADAKLSGEADDDYSGGSVASGDFNNDGYDDLLIGALNEDAGGSNAGAAYMVFGPISGDVGLSSADAKLTGTGASDQAGKSVASVGDVNNDGNDDLLIAGYKNDDVDTNAGSAYLFYGPATSGDLSNADVVFQGVSAQDMAGSWVSAAGDVDGDGYDDVLVGAYRADVEREGNTVSNVGITYLLQGPLSGTMSLSAADASFIGENANDQSGAQISQAGDVNNDGYDDFLIGAERADKNGSDDGAAYLVLGPVSGEVELSAADAIFTGENDNDRAGRGVGAAGDLNNDGYDDLLFGAKENDNSATGAGAAYVVLGPITGTLSLSAADGIYTGASAGDQAGMWVTSAGDVSGDGSPDMLVGGNSANAGSGATYLLLGDSWR